MATLIQAVVTDKGREVIAKKMLGSMIGYGQPILSYFQIGEGGFAETISGRVPKDPDPSRTALEATGDPGNYIFQKSFSPLDVGFSGPYSINLTAFVGLGEANDDGLGEPPRFFEMGLFDDENNMIVYMTFPEETKTADKTLNHVITITF
jgi:hypothetical protein